MRLFFRWLVLGVGGLLTIVIVAGTVLYLLGDRRLNRPHDVELQAVAIPTDSAFIERGLGPAWCAPCGSNLRTGPQRPAPGGTGWLDAQPVHHVDANGRYTGRAHAERGLDAVGQVLAIDRRGTGRDLTPDRGDGAIGLNRGPRQR
jgi:hypothetical protein